jgi:DNA-binding MarR family transcriptional regulator
MRRWRYVTFTPDPGRGKRPGKDALIAPTRGGIAARDTWQQVTTDVEARWRDRLGASAFDALRGALAGIAENLDPGLPDCLPILGYGLFTRRDPVAISRGGEPAMSGGARAQAARTPAGHVAGGLAGLPLWALLSRPLLAFALQYESELGPSLAMSADLLRVLTERGVLVKDIPALAGVSKEGVAMAMTALRGFGLAAEEPDPAGSRFRLARLTRRGARARDEYPALAADIEADWHARFGDETVSALRRALEPLATGDPPPLFAGLEPYPDNWRARGKPVSVLPHYPMTLHRGGYPDGS